MDDDRVFRSKVDWWLALVLIGLVVMSLVYLVLGTRMLAGGNPTGDAWWFIGPALGMLALFGLLVWPVRYVLTSQHLIIRFGVARSRIELCTITGVVPSRNPLSSPALSLDRLKVSFTGGFGFTLISPTDKHAFMRDLVERCDGLEYRDGKVVQLGS